MFWSKPPTTILWQMDRSLEWSGGVSFNEKFNNQKEEKFLSSKHFMHLWNIWKSFDSFSSIFSLNPDLLVVPRRTILHLCCDCCDCSLSCPACQASGPTLDQSQTLLDMSEPSASTLHWLIDWLTFRFMNKTVKSMLFTIHLVQGDASFPTHFCL